MPGTVPSTFTYTISFILIASKLGAGTINIPTLQMRKGEITQGHTAQWDRHQTFTGSWSGSEGHGDQLLY